MITSRMEAASAIESDGRCCGRRGGLTSALGVTDGIRGASNFVAIDAQTVAGPRRLGRFPAGRSDAFLGGLLAALDRGDAPVDAIELAAVAGQRAGRRSGPLRLTPGLNGSQSLTCALWRYVG